MKSSVDTQTPVVILKMHHQCGLGIARTLGRWGVPVYAVHERAEGPAISSRYVRERFVLDLDRTPSEVSALRLLEIASRFPTRPLLVPTDDVTSMVLAENAAALGEGFLFPRQPPGLAEKLYSKEGMEGLCAEHGVPTPKTYFPKQLADVESLLTDIAYPVMLKGIDSTRLEARTGVRMRRVEDERELIEWYRRLEDAEHPNLMVQEYIPGDATSVWMLDAYFDDDSNCLFAAGGQKIRQFPPYVGMTSLGICRSNARVEQTVMTFMKKLSYRGPLDIGFRYDVRDDGYKLLDVNPPVGATFRLFTGERDTDIVRAMYLHLTGQEVEPDRPREGRKWVVENYDISATRTYLRDGEVTVWSWLRSFRGVQEAAWFARDDLRPFLKTVWEFISMRLRNLFRRRLGTGSG